MSREPITLFEFDIPYCTLQYGVGACPAVLGTDSDFKCFNTLATCPVQQSFVEGIKTVRCMQPRPTYPKGATVFPMLKSISGRSATVNVAGSDDKMDSLGKRASITVDLIDIPYHDRFFDLYQSERISGAAQVDEGPYDPATRGTVWTRIKARLPNYSGIPCRKLDGYIEEDGTLTISYTRHYIANNIKGPDKRGNVTVTAKDVLSLADDKKAVAPAPSRGELLTDITDVATSLTLSPAGIGDEYPASGRALIGSEIVEFTRSGDVMTITRDYYNTGASSHNLGDTVQLTYSVTGQRIDAVISELLVDYAGVDAAFIPTAKWTAEIDRWAPFLLLTADIVKPTGVNKLTGELAALGVSIWWDEVEQEIGLKVNRPVDNDVVHDFSDATNLTDIEQDLREDDRLTEVYFNTVQVNPVDGVDEKNFARSTQFISLPAKFLYGDTRIKTINCRWLNQGADSLVLILATRLANRFTSSPTQYIMSLDAKDQVALTDVINLTTRVTSHPTGRSTTEAVQAIRVEDDHTGHSIKVTAQRYGFGLDRRYPYFTENTRPVYSLSNSAQRDRGAYFVDGGTLEFAADGGLPYSFI